MSPPHPKPLSFGYYLVKKRKLAAPQPNNLNAVELASSAFISTKTNLVLLNGVDAHCWGKWSERVGNTEEVRLGSKKRHAMGRQNRAVHCVAVLLSQRVPRVYAER
jgi:hypothetical protein